MYLPRFCFYLGLFSLALACYVRSWQPLTKEFLRAQDALIWSYARKTARNSSNSLNLFDIQSLVTKKKWPSLLSLFYEREFAG